jgi:peptidoglycan-associated lipoprotein
MQFNKIFKGLVIALPVVTMVACSSGPSEAEAEAERNRAAAQAEADRRAQDAQTQTGSIGRVLSPVEEKKQQLEAVQSNQVVYFDFDRASISSQYFDVLDQHAAFLTKYPEQSVVVEGHCDSRGTPEYNIALGESRAKSVQTYLLNAGVSPSQISVVSYGEEKPVNTSNTEAAYAENRRGVLVYR